MLIFTLILFSFSHKLSFDRLQNLTSLLSNLESNQISEEDFEKELQSFEIEEESNQYKLKVSGLAQNKDDFQQLIGESSTIKYFVFHPAGKNVELNYAFSEEKCIKKIDFKKPENLSNNDFCFWVNDLKNTLTLSGKKNVFNGFNGSWEDDECIKTEFINIKSSSNKLTASKAVCFSEIEIKFDDD